MTWRSEDATKGEKETADYTDCADSSSPSVPSAQSAVKLYRSLFEGHLTDELYSSLRFSLFPSVHFFSHRLPDSISTLLASKIGIRFSLDESEYIFRQKNQKENKKNAGYHEAEISFVYGTPSQNKRDRY